MGRAFALWRCRFLGWHPLRYRVPVYVAGEVAAHTLCTRCQLVGVVDTLGNLFV